MPSVVNEGPRDSYIMAISAPGTGKVRSLTAKFHHAHKCNRCHYLDRLGICIILGDITLEPIIQQTACAALRRAAYKTQTRELLEQNVHDLPWMRN